MKKLIKWIVGLGTVGTAIGLLAVRLMNQMIRLLKTNNKKESGWFNLTLNKIERSASLFY